MRFAVLIAIVAAATMAGSAVAALPTFTNGPLVARKMEAHYNGATYKAKLAKIKARLTTRVLCAYDGSLRTVECDGKASIQGATKRYLVSVQWELEKLAVNRARLRWTMSGSGASQSQREIVAPSAFGLKRF